MIQWTRENRKSSNQTKSWFFENRKNLCKIIHKKEGSKKIKKPKEHRGAAEIKHVRYHE